MIEELIISIAANAPATAVLFYFLHLSFKQRQSTMEMMTTIVEKFMDVVSACCDDEEI